jgi:hypothetical protein
MQPIVLRVPLLIRTHHFDRSDLQQWAQHVSRTAMLDNPVTYNPINVHASESYRLGCRFDSKP